jgi:hypothetical protein
MFTDVSEECFSLERQRYCNGFDQHIARQQLGKHLLLVLHDNNWESMGKRMLELVARQRFCKQSNKQHLDLDSL